MSMRVTLEVLIRQVSEHAIEIAKLKKELEDMRNQAPQKQPTLGVPKRG